MLSKVLLTVHRGISHSCANAPWRAISASCTTKKTGCMSRRQEWQGERYAHPKISQCPTLHDIRSEGSTGLFFGCNVWNVTSCSALHMRQGLFRWILWSICKRCANENPLMYSKAAPCGLGVRGNAGRKLVAQQASMGGTYAVRTYDLHCAETTLSPPL